MKVLIVMPSGQPRGGAEEALLHLVAERKAAGFVRLVVVFLEPGDLQDRVEELGGETIRLDSGRLRDAGRLIGTLAALRRAVGKLRPDVILSWMPKAHVYGGLVASLHGVPAVYFQMGLADHGNVDRLSLLIPARGVLACSEFAAKVQAACTRVPVVGVPLAADLERFDPGKFGNRATLRERLGLPAHRPVIGIVGRLQRWKGMHVFAEALGAVLASHPEVLGVLVGGIHDLEPDYEPWLRSQIAEFGLGDHLRMVGKQTNVPDWMMAMDIVIHASDREPFGIVVLEAMALGKPVIASIPGGPEEIVTDGEDGILVTSGDAGALAAAMRRFLDDPALAESCGRKAQVRARDFSPRHFAERVGQVVSRMISV